MDPIRYNGSSNKVMTVVVAALALAGGARALQASSGFKSKDSFVVHEWGTFTSVQGSDGVSLAGLQHEEEALPAFVHGRDPLAEAERQSSSNPGGAYPCRFKCAFSQLLNAIPLVTQKMETPVLYFHSSQARPVELSVQFPLGVISQYFPNPTSFLPEIGQVGGQLQGGQIDYSLQVLAPGDRGAPPAVDAQNVYAPARNVGSNTVRVGSEDEKFIFYRGLGFFQSNLHVTSQADGSIQLNLTRKADTAPSVFLVNVLPNEAGGSILALGSIGAAGKGVSADRVHALLAHPLGLKAFQAEAGRELVTALTRSGLYADEAVAMLETWRRSYFKSPGLRVLYVLNRPETDQLLPITISPAPSELVRTMVGRVEVFTRQDEIASLAQLEKGGADYFPLETFGRFLEPKLTRMDSLITDDRYEVLSHKLPDESRLATLDRMQAELSRLKVRAAQTGLFTLRP